MRLSGKSVTLTFVALQSFALLLSYALAISSGHHPMYPLHTISQLVGRMQPEASIFSLLSMLAMPVHALTVWLHWSHLHDARPHTTTNALSRAACGACGALGAATVLCLALTGALNTNDFGVVHIGAAYAWFVAAALYHCVVCAVLWEWGTHDGKLYLKTALCLVECACVFVGGPLALAEWLVGSPKAGMEYVFCAAFLAFTASFAWDLRHVSVSIAVSSSSSDASSRDEELAQLQA